MSFFWCILSFGPALEPGIKGLRVSFFTVIILLSWKPKLLSGLPINR